MINTKTDLVIEVPDINGGYSRASFQETRVKHDEVPCLRIYRYNYPDGFKIQVRASVILETESRNHKAKARNLIATLDLNMDQLREIAEYVNQLEKATV